MLLRAVAKQFGLGRLGYENALPRLLMTKTLYP